LTDGVVKYQVMLLQRFHLHKWVEMVNLPVGLAVSCQTTKAGGM